MEQNGMTAEREGAILERAIEAFGEGAQIDKCVEEMAELTQALMRARCDQRRRESVEHVCEKIADVQIMLNQMRLIFGDDGEWEEYKLLRLEKRLDNRTASNVVC